MTSADQLAIDTPGTEPAGNRRLSYGLAAVYLPKSLTRAEQAELRVRLGARRPADLELLARRRREARR